MKCTRQDLIFSQNEALKFGYQGWCKLLAEGVGTARITTEIFKEIPPQSHVLELTLSQQVLVILIPA